MHWITNIPESMIEDFKSFIKLPIVVGDPQPTKKLSKEKLKEHKIVGIYVGGDSEN